MYIGKNIVYKGFNTIHGFRGSWNIYPMDKGGTTVSGRIAVIIKGENVPYFLVDSHLGMRKILKG